MVPYLLGLAGIHNLVVGRLNEHAKQSMRAQRSMIFNWAQPWEQVSITFTTKIPTPQFWTGKI